MRECMYSIVTLVSHRGDNPTGIEVEHKSSQNITIEWIVNFQSTNIVVTYLYHIVSDIIVIIFVTSTTYDSFLSFTPISFQIRTANLQNQWK